MLPRSKSAIRRFPLLGSLAVRINRLFRRRHNRSEPFSGSQIYWEDRYASGGDSGDGSHGKLAKFKAAIVNDFVARNEIHSVIDFGCGDGSQLKLAEYPHYLGLDVSKTAVSRCRSLFAAHDDKTFMMMDDYDGQEADLALSMDVIFHLVEQDVYETYMETLFQSARRSVIIYSSNAAVGKDLSGPHEKHRVFTDWTDANLTTWRLQRQVANPFPLQKATGKGSLADFYIYETVKTIPVLTPP